MKITLEIRENTRQLPHQQWPWEIVARYEPGRRTTTSYAWSLDEAFAKLAKIVKEDL